jgi:two-component system OmpR family sensor kinase
MKTLRGRMVLTLLGLAAVTLAITSIAGILILRHYQTGRLDNEVTRLSQVAARPYFTEGRFRPPDSGSPGSRRSPQPTAPPAISVAPPTASPSPASPSTALRSPALPGATANATPSPSATASPSQPLCAELWRGPNPAAESNAWPECAAFPTGVGDNALFLVYDAQGNPVRGPRNIDPADGPDLGSFADIKKLAGQPITTLSNAASGERFRVKVTLTPHGDYAVAAISLARADATTTQMTVVSVAVGLGVLALVGLGSYYLVGIALRPLTRMEHAADAITQGDLSARVPDTNPHSEPGRLGIALNTMLGRVEAAVAARTTSEQKLRRFLADVSHELRTPLTSIRGFAELYRRGGAPAGPQLDETMSRIEAEAARMGLLVEDLLQLAALDESPPLRRAPVDLLEIAADTIRDAHVRNPSRKVELATFEPVTVDGDEYQLRQLAANVIGNALQHTPATAGITVRVTTSGTPLSRGEVTASVGIMPTTAVVAVIEIADTGPGIAPEHTQHIFERLYRAEPSRSRNHGGAGLGLAIAASIIKAHHGRIELSTQPGAGATFRIVLPIAQH